MLLVGSEVQDQVCLGDELLIGAHGEAVIGGVLPGLAFFGDGAVAQGVRNIEPAVAQIEALVEALCAAADDNQLFAAQFVHAISKLCCVHEAAFAELLQLQAQWQCVEVVLSHGTALS